MFASSTVIAENFTKPTNVRIEGDKLVWDPVEGAGGYNINTGFGSYLTTVKNRTDFQLQVDGRYSVIAFDVSATLFSSPSTAVTYEAGSDSAVSVSSDINNRVQVVSVTCQNVGPGESCSVSCRISGSFGVATGGACATSDIVESDATAGPTSYSCTVPTFSGEVTAQVYCMR